MASRTNSKSAPIRGRMASAIADWSAPALDASEMTAMSVPANSSRNGARTTMGKTPQTSTVSGLRAIKPVPTPTASVIEKSAIASS